MKSYASIDRLEGNYAVCEVELVPVEESKKLSFSEKETEILDVQLNKIIEAYADVQEGDIIIVEYENDEIICVYGKDEAEKQRRVELLRKIMNS